MRPLFAAVFAVSVGLSLACGGGGSSFAIPSVEVVGPWAAMGAPFDGGNAIQSDNERLVVQYDSGSRKERITPYVDALKKDGWEQVYEGDDNDVTTYTLKKGDMNCGISAVEMDMMGTKMITVSALFTGP
jgi:hypothetical protein